jgi:hypothetical protein
MTRNARAVTVAVGTLLAWAQPALAQWVEPDCRAILEVQGPQNGDLFGWLVAATGDVDGDGVGDFVTCSPFYDTGQSSVGRVAVYSGAGGAQRWARTTSLFSAILGFSLEVAGDLDGDGIRDVVAGAPWNTGLPGGQAIVYSGATGATLHVFPGAAQFDAMGHSIAVNGDFDGDGTGDMVVSAPYVGGGGVGSGRVFVHSAADHALLCEIVPPALPEGYQFGTGLAFIGDVDGRPGAELVIGQRLTEGGSEGRLLVMACDGAGAGIVYVIEPVYLGGAFDGDRIEAGRDIDGDGTGDIFAGNISDAAPARVFSGDDGGELYALDGEGEGGGFGPGSFIDDVDGDGVADLIVCARLNDAGAVNGGKVFVYSGRDGSLIRTMTHTVADQRFGAHAAPIGDHDGDGIGDYLVGASGPSTGGLPRGRVFIMAGTAGPCPGDLDGSGAVGEADVAAIVQSWGECPGCPGDLDGDGRVGMADLLALLRAWGRCG